MTAPNCTTHFHACDCREALFGEMVEALAELANSIERRWEGETDRKRANSVSPRTEEALIAARALIARATDQGEMK